MKRKKPPTRRKSAPTSVGDILARMATQTPLGKQLELAQIWEKWPELAGANLHGHGRPHGVRDMTLIIEVDSTVWMNRYAYQKWHILQRVNKLYGRELISDIFLLLTSETEEG